MKGDATNALTCNLTIDNVYSRYQKMGQGRTTGGLVFEPNVNGSSLSVNLVGDNRVGNIHYYSGKNGNGTLLYRNELILQGTGSLTVASVDFSKSVRDQSKSSSTYKGDDIYGYDSNWWCSAIGGNDSGEGNAIGIKIKSGTIFAGTTQTENCTAIGGGGNDRGYVTIEGGSVTAVATTTGTAIGGGIGFTSTGGIGVVNISGGAVYAYNHANEWEIPSAAIGSAGSWASAGGSGVVAISGGYVYAQTALGTAIGGGSSKTREGGDAEVNISGNAYVIAKSIEAQDKYIGEIYPAGNGIGGGTGGTGTATTKGSPPSYGGSATVTITGSPIIRTGSVGGGKTNNPAGKIGSATITIDGGDISAQFIMAGGAGAVSTFTMNDGTISNSRVKDKEYFHAVKNGGAVYMEDGTFTMKGGTICNCDAETGGAIYIKKSANAVKNPEFYMEGGTIENCVSETHGGAVYLEGGNVTLKGGTIQGNVAGQGHGGAVYVKAGNFYMKENTPLITSNSALRRGSTDAGDGGGIYVSSEKTNVEVQILSGTITNNSCDGNGGGICVDMSANENNQANVIIGNEGTTNPSITLNSAVMYGGGLYAEGVKANVTINGGRIRENNVPNYVPNEDIANEKGTVTLNGGDVPYKTVTFVANATDATVEGKSQVEQKIVTNTNSLLKLPQEPTRELYDFVGWNRRQDGLDPEVFYDGKIMTLKEDLTLYAIWKAQ